MIEKGFIFDIKKFAIHDGPGIRSTVFLKGCPLECWWCHNPEGQNPEPEKMEGKDIVGEEVTVDWVIKEIEKDRIFYDQSGGGVTFSGGEPLMQPEFLQQLVLECKKRGIHTTLDTSGYAPADVFTPFINVVDLFLYDLKIIDEKQHISYTGVSNQLILENLKELDNANKKVFIRFLVIPGITDNKENVEATAQVISPFNNIEEIDLLTYHKLAGEKYKKLGKEYKMKHVDTIKKEELEAVKKAFEHYGFTVNIGG